MRGAKPFAIMLTLSLALGTNLSANSQIPWIGNWQEASSLALRHQRLVLIHFWSNNCPACVRLERSVLNNPEVIRAIAANYVPLKVNVNENAELARYYRVEQWPTDVLVTAQGAELFRGVSPQDPNRYIATLDQVAAHARVGMPVSGSPSIDVAMTGPSSASPWASAFPTGPSGGVTGSARYPENVPQNTPWPAEDRGYAPANRSTAAHGSWSGASSADSIPPRAAYMTNQFAAEPASSAAAYDQPASYTPNRSGEFPVAAYPPQRDSGQTAAWQAPSQDAPRGLGAPAGVVLAAAESAGQAAGSSTPALDGYCSVTLVEQEKWVKGDPRWGAVHRGRTYLFASPQEQQRFLADFDQYAPALSGYDCVRYVEQGSLWEGKRSHGIFYRGQVFLFADEASLQQFWQAPERYVPYVVAEQQRPTSRR